MLINKAPLYQNQSEAVEKRLFLVIYENLEGQKQ